jgi:hypothetical protein
VVGVPLEEQRMYDDELAFTGLGSVAIGGVVFGAVWLAVVAFVVIGAGLLLCRVAATRPN